MRVRVRVRVRIWAGSWAGVRVHVPRGVLAGADHEHTDAGRLPHKRNVEVTCGLSS